MKVNNDHLLLKEQHQSLDYGKPKLKGKESLQTLGMLSSKGMSSRPETKEAILSPNKVVLSQAKGQKIFIENIESRPNNHRNEFLNVYG